LNASDTLKEERKRDRETEKFLRAWIFIAQDALRFRDDKNMPDPNRQSRSQGTEKKERKKGRERKGNERGIPFSLRSVISVAIRRKFHRRER